MKRPLVFCIAILGSFVATSGEARIIHVPADSSSIQAGINGAVDGDTVLVARGHYYERLDFAWTAILVASNFILDNDTTTIDSTVIDGGTAGAVVVFPGYGPSASTIQGFTITGGYSGERERTDGWSGRSGITRDIMTDNYADYVDRELVHKDNPPVITNNIITGNDGVGIYCEGYIPTITSNAVPGGSVSRGGGVYCWSTAPTVKYNVVMNNSGSGIICETSSPSIYGNHVTDNGGHGILCEMFSSPTILSNTVVGNSAKGLFCRDLSSPAIRGNTISGNLAGGILCWWDSSPLIDSNTVSYNSSDIGGGICCEQSSPVITNNEITCNSAYAGGGGISCVVSSPTIQNNIVSGNSAGYYGGGILCDHLCYSVIQENTITGNSVDSEGGGIYCMINCSPAITNNTIVGNRAVLAGGGIRCGFGSWPVISSNIISNSLDGEGISCESGSNATIRHNDVRNNADGDFDNCPPGVGDMTWGTNVNGDPCDSFFNISCPPLFCYPDTGNYYLAGNSCCLGAGEVGVDIGAFGVGCPAYVLGDANGDGTIDIGDVVYLINYLYKGGSAPDPLPAGDTNSDGVVDLGDVVYLINYLYKGGPPP
jgi:parallel beta-helix repeat protein